MRKIMIAIAAMLVLASCEKENNELTFEKVVKSDYEYLKENTSDELFFYEVQCTLNGDVSKLKNVKVLESKTIAVSNDIVYFITTDFQTKDRQIETIPGRWMGSFNIEDPTNLLISFDRAVHILKSQKDVEVPSSDKMTLRNPTSSLYGNPLYIFGSSATGSYVAIDANLGEVINMGKNGSLIQSGIWQK